MNNEYLFIYRAYLIYGWTLGIVGKSLYWQYDFDRTRGGRFNVCFDRIPILYNTLGVG
jgi:hypothetical protein